MSPDPEGAHPVERDRIVEALCEHYARDRLEIEEFERRVERAHRARTRDELRALLADLPSLEGPGAPPAVRGGGHLEPRKGTATGGSGLPDRRLHPSQAPERQTEVAIWSGRVRKGAWTPARQIRAFGFMGGVEIIVPPGVRVETDGFAFMGGFEEDTEVGADVPPDAPVIRVTGFVFMGGVEVSSRYPGENARQARRRRKEEARRRLPGGSG
jgi:hypothetical protein